MPDMDDMSRTTSHHVTSHGTHQGVTVHEAAAALGLSEEAVRARLRRGTLDGWKADDDTWRVRLPEGVTISERPSVTGVAVENDVPSLRDGTHHDAQHGTQRDMTDGALVTHLQEEVTYLRERLEDAMGQLAEERRRADVLQREALGRIEALAATVDRQPPTENAPEPVGSTESSETPVQGVIRMAAPAPGQIAGILAMLRRLLRGTQ